MYFLGWNSKLNMYMWPLTQIFFDLFNYLFLSIYFFLHFLKSSFLANDFFYFFIFDQHQQPHRVRSNLKSSPSYSMLKWSACRKCLYWSRSSRKWMYWRNLEWKVKREWSLQVKNKIWCNVVCCSWNKNKISSSIETFKDPSVSFLLKKKSIFFEGLCQ